MFRNVLQLENRIYQSFYQIQSPQSLTKLNIKINLGKQKINENHFLCKL